MNKVQNNKNKRKLRKLMKDSKKPNKLLTNQIKMKLI
jgi:hypothetical protein